MPSETRPLSSELHLVLRACEELLADARRGEVLPVDWTLEELEQLRTDVAAQLVAEALDLDPFFVRP